MTYPHGGAASIWRDNEAGSPHNPVKSEIRDYMKFVEGRAGGLAFADFGCSTGVDSTAAFQSALEAANGAPIRLDGTIRIDGAVAYDGPVNIWSPGDAGKLDLSGGGAISFIAGLTALPNLNAAIQQYDNEVSFASAHGLSVGDVFCVYNPTDYSFNPQRDSYRDGDWIEVAEVPNVNDVVMFGTSPDLYAASDIECYKMEGEGVSILGVTVIPNPSGVHFSIQNHKQVDCRMGYERGADYAGVQILRCYNIKFECLPMDVNQDDAYPVSIGNSKNFTVDLDRSRSTRHVAGFGGSGGPGSVPNRNGKIIGARLTNNIDGGIGAADFHGNNDNLQYIGCDIYGANMGGRNSALLGCTLYGRYPYDNDDNVIYSSANGGGLTRIHDCTLKVRGSANPFAFIHFDLLNLAADACFDIRNLVVDHADTGAPAQQVLEFNLGTPITISGATQANPCVVSATGHGLVTGQQVKIKGVAGMTELNGNTYTVTVIDANSFSLDADSTGFTVYTSGGTAAHPYKIDIVLDGLNYRGAAPERLFEFSGTQDFVDQISLTVDNIKLPYCTLVRCSNADSYDMPMRLPKTTVSAGLSVTTGANYFSTNLLTYQWIYPRVPNGAVSIHPTDQAHFAQTPFPTANLRRVRTGDCHLAISSFDGANFTFAKDFRIVGEFWINDIL